jgi:hypothetical protein
MDPMSRQSSTTVGAADSRALGREPLLATWVSHRMATFARDSSGSLSAGPLSLESPSCSVASSDNRSYTTLRMRDLPEPKATVCQMLYVMEMILSRLNFGLALRSGATPSTRCRN